MTSADFIKRIRIAVYESSIEGTFSLLKKPPGRRPSPSLVALSQWHKQLSAHDKGHLAATVKLATRAAVFGMLAVLDGATSIREPGEERGSLELRYTAGSESILLNAPDRELLHDLFAAEVPPA